MRENEGFSVEQIAAAIRALVDMGVLEHIEGDTYRLTRAVMDIRESGQGLPLEDAINAVVRSCT